MIHLVSETFSPRIHFTAKLLFQELMGTDYELIGWEEASILPESALIVNYTDKPLENSLYIPDSGLLAEKGVRKALPTVEWQNGFPLLFPADNKGPVSFDLLAASFYLASGYAYYQANQFDKHGRYDENQLFIIKNQLHHEPWVHHYTKFLSDCFRQFSSEIFTNPPQPDYEITWDIDNPWAFQHKKPLKQIRGLVKDALKGDFHILRHRWAVLNGNQKDPFDTYALMQELSPPAKTTLFFLLNGKSPFDSAFGHENLQYRSLIKSFVEKGYTTGIHLSYESFQNGALIKEEKAALENIIDKQVIFSRQHFLKVKIPETPQLLERAGIKHDYSICPIHDIGFLFGMAQPFQWFDLTVNEAKDLTLHPTLVMDRSLQRYKGLKPEAALDSMEALKVKTYQAGGKFLILLHNETLSEFREWAGWQKPVSEFIANLAKHDQ